MWPQRRWPACRVTTIRTSRHLPRMPKKSRGGRAGTRHMMTWSSTACQPPTAPLLHPSHPSQPLLWRLLKPRQLLLLPPPLRRRWPSLLALWSRFLVESNAAAAHSTLVAPKMTATSTILLVRTALRSRQMSGSVILVGTSTRTATKMSPISRSRPRSLTRLLP